MNNIGKPCAGKPHARFDEGWQAEWPEGDRPREMLLEKDPEALSDAALLAILMVEDTHPFVFPKLQNKLT